MRPPDMFLHSLRWCIQIWHAVLLTGVLAGFGATAYGLVRTTQLHGLDADLQRYIPQLVRRLEPGRPPPPGSQRGPGRGVGRGGPEDFRGPPPEDGRPPGAGSLTFQEGQGRYFIAWDGGGRVIERSADAPELPKPSELPPRGGFLGRTRAGRRELIHRTPPGDMILVGASAEAELNSLARMAWWLAAAGAGVLGIGLAGGAWIAARALRPIEDITKAAGEIAAGDLARRISTSDKVSELGRLAAVLNGTFGRLEAAFEQQARFTADASHELRTPVSVLLTQTQSALARERTPEQYRAALESCGRAGERMRRLIESLLELARFDAGQEQVRCEPLDLAEPARSALELVAPLAAEGQITLDRALPPTPCRGDADHLTQVAANLLTNAIKFNSPGGRARLELGRSGREVFLRVTDDGVGIPAEAAPRLFERFFRADPSRTRATGSNGLGLAICKAIAEAHGGRMEAASRPGEGSVFTLWLPAPPEASPAQ